jgi:hypothetical protein
VREIKEATAFAWEMLDIAIREVLANSLDNFYHPG